MLDDEQYHRDFDRDFAAHERRLRRDAWTRIAGNLALLALYLAVGAAAAFALLMLLGWA